MRFLRHLAIHVIATAIPIIINGVIESRSLLWTPVPGLIMSSSYGKSNITLKSAEPESELYARSQHVASTDQFPPMRSTGTPASETRSIE